MTSPKLGNCSVNIDSIIITKHWWAQTRLPRSDYGPGNQRLPDNGINPVTENVTLQIGLFSVTIPPGSFQKNPNGRFAFQGVINGVSLQVQIVPLGNNIFTFKADGTGVDLTGLSNPVTVVLTTGIDSGTTTAEFQ